MADNISKIQIGDTVYDLKDPVARESSSPIMFKDVNTLADIKNALKEAVTDGYNMVALKVGSTHLYTDNDLKTVDISNSTLLLNRKNNTSWNGINYHAVGNGTILGNYVFDVFYEESRDSFYFNSVITYDNVYGYENFETLNDIISSVKTASISDKSIVIMNACDRFETSNGITIDGVDHNVNLILYNFYNTTMKIGSLQWTGFMTVDDGSVYSVVIPMSAYNATPTGVYAYPLSSGNVSEKNILALTCPKESTINGITFVVNDDGSITANGTATGTVRLLLNTTMIIPKGKWIWGSSDNPIFPGVYLSLQPKISIPNGWVDAVSAKKEAEFTLSEDSEIENARLFVNQGLTLNNLTVYPMLRRADITDGSFVKGIMTNEELTRHSTLSPDTTISNSEYNISARYVTYGKLVILSVGTNKLDKQINTGSWQTIFTGIPTVVFGSQIMTNTMNSKDMNINIFGNTLQMLARQNPVGVSDGFWATIVYITN